MKNGAAQASPITHFVLSGDWKVKHPGENTLALGMLTVAAIFTETMNTTHNMLPFGVKIENLWLQ